MKKIILSAFLTAVIFSQSCFAACTGSGLSWSCTANTSSADLQSCINSATSGATIAIGAGSGTWTSKVVISKSLTLIGATTGCPTACDNGTVITNGTGTYLLEVSSAGDLSIDISGLTLNGNSTSSSLVYAHNSSTQNPLYNLRVHHNELKSCTGIAFTVGPGAVFGLADNNKFTTNGYAFKAYGGQSASWQYWPGEANLGSRNYFYFEDNISTGTSTVLGSSGEGARWVWRYNHAESTTGGSQTMMLDAHGDTNNRGVVAHEIYENTYNGIASQGYDYRGGAGVIFNNTWTAAAGLYTGWISIREEHPECTSSGGCPYTVSISGVCADEVNNGYIWNNLKTAGTRLEVSESDCMPCAYPYGATSVDCLTAQANYWSDTVGANDSGYFTKGLGANKPSAASNNQDVYWATDTRILYRAVTGTTWTQVYTPYTYPHPLRGESVTTIPAGVHIGGGIEIK